MLLITGCAGFIGFHLAKKRLEMGELVVGVDNLNDYYDVSLKEARLKQLQKFPNFIFEKLDISDRDLVPDLFNKYKFTRKTIISILNQTYRNIEIILVDDGSTDLTCELKNEFNNSIKYIYTKIRGQALQET